jgi:AcrR family transcriptional regulator
VARPRTKSDDDLLDGILAAMRRTGPAGLTFAGAASAAGLAAPTLVQRFGTRDQMVKAALMRAWDLLDARTEEAVAATPGTAAGAVDLLVALSRDYGEGEDYADGFLFLREDMRDPDLRRRGAAWGERLAAVLAKRLGAPAAARRARLMLSLWQGAVLWWGFTREGHLTDAVARLLGDGAAALGPPPRPRRD